MPISVRSPSNFSRVILKLLEAVREADSCNSRAHLHDALQSVTRQRAHRAKDRNQDQPHRSSNPPPQRNKKLLAPPGSQESSVPARAGTVMANSIAFNLVPRR